MCFLSCFFRYLCFSKETRKHQNTNKTIKMQGNAISTHNNILWGPQACAPPAGHGLGVWLVWAWRGRGVFVSKTIPSTKPYLRSAKNLLR